MNKKFKSFVAILLAILMLFSLVSVVFTIVANADDDTTTEEEFKSELERLNKEKQKASENVATAQNKVEALKAEQALAIEEKIALEERNDAAQEELELIEKQVQLVKKEIENYDKKIAAKELEVQAALENENNQLERYRTRIRAMEESGGYSLLSFILSAESISELLSAFDDYSDIMNSDVVMYRQLQDAREEHQRVEAEFVSLRAECEEQKAAFEQDIRGLEQERKELQIKIKESEKIIDEFTEKIKEAEEEQKRMEAIESAAASAAAGFVAQYYQEKAAQSTANVGSGSESVTVVSIDENGNEVVESTSTGSSTGITTYADGNGTGSYCWPFPGHSNITSPFGYRASTGSYHTGIDIDGYQSMGAAIVAADSGTVIKAAYSGGYGNCIIIDHGNGICTLYAHLSSMSVGVGSSVGQGQTIGGVGNTGTCYGIDGIHLHFEVIVNGQQVDPQGYI